MPYSGTLMTRVFTSRSQLPVEDAAVSILQHEPGGRQRLINIQTSDRLSLIHIARQNHLRLHPDTPSHPGDPCGNGCDGTRRHIGLGHTGGEVGDDL